MSILCGWASQSEKGTINGNKGDQTGKEVKLGNYYDFGQNEIIRFKNPSRRKKAAKAMKALCRNERIGYGQYDRSTLYKECQRIKWDISRISEIKKCNCDCSEICGCCINFAYGKEVVPSTITTATFEINTIKKYPAKFKEITNMNGKKKRGDMPLKAGKHVIMVVDI